MSRARAFPSATSSSDFCCNEHDRGHYPVREWVPRYARPRVRAAEPSGDRSPSGMPGRSPVIRCPSSSMALPPSLQRSCEPCLLGARATSPSPHAGPPARRRLATPRTEGTRAERHRVEDPSRRKRRAPTRHSARAPRGHRDGPCGAGGDRTDDVPTEGRVSRRLLREEEDDVGAAEVLSIVDRSFAPARDCSRWARAGPEFVPASSRSAWMGAGPRRLFHQSPDAT